MQKIVLKSGKDQSVRRYHPWIFSGAIKKIYCSPAEGDDLPGLIVDYYEGVAVIQYFKNIGKTEYYEF